MHVNRSHSRLYKNLSHLRGVKNKTYNDVMMLHFSVLTIVKTLVTSSLHAVVE